MNRIHRRVAGHKRPEPPRARGDPQQTTRPVLRQDRPAAARPLRAHRHTGRLVHAVHRAARQAQPTYEALCDTVRGSPVVTPDETGWKVGGHPWWLWAFVTRDTTVYAIQ
ncbi:MAG: transposase, partial [Acidobacteria bacterium]|nr:transposase [Acidobacteriota bacterium]